MIIFAVFSYFVLLACTVISIQAETLNSNELKTTSFHKRAGEETSSNSRNQASSSGPQRHFEPANQASREFYRSIQGHAVSGVIHVGIKGERLSHVDTPTVVHYGGKRGGRIVDTFIKSPSPPRGESRSPSPTPPQVGKTGEICIHIGECQTIHYIGTGSESTGSKIRHVDTKSPGAALRYNNNIRFIKLNGGKHLKTSVTTIEPSPDQHQDHPMISIFPGKKSGHYFSEFHIPINSPSTSTQNVPSSKDVHPQHSPRSSPTRSREELNLNPNPRSPPTSHQIIGQKRKQGDRLNDQK